MSTYEHMHNLHLNFSEQLESSKSKNISAYFTPLSWMNFIVPVTKNDTNELLEVKDSHVMISGKEPIQMKPVDQDFFQKIISNKIREINACEIHFSIPQTDENVFLFSSIKNFRGILLIKVPNSDIDFFQMGSEGMPLNFKNMHLDYSVEEFRISVGSSFPYIPVYTYTGCFPIPEAV